MAPINLPDGTEVSEVILPDGASASEVVAPDGSTVFIAIPDNIDHRFKMDEGSGSELADAIGSLTASWNGGWVSNSKYTGEVATDHDGNDDFWVTDQQFGINNDQASVAGWAQIDDFEDATDLVATASGTSSSDGQSADGHVLQMRTGGDLEVVIRNNGNNTTVATATGLTFSDDLFYGLALDGNSVSLYVYDNSSKVADVSGSTTRNTGNNVYYRSCQPNFDRYNDGPYDDWMFSTTSALSESGFKSIRDLTNR